MRLNTSFMIARTAFQSVCVVPTREVGFWCSAATASMKQISFVQEIRGLFPFFAACMSLLAGIAPRGNTSIFTVCCGAVNVLLGILFASMCAVIGMC